MSAAYIKRGIAMVFGNDGIGWGNNSLWCNLEGSRLYADGVVYDRWNPWTDARLTRMALTIGSVAADVLGIRGACAATLVCDDFGQLVQVGGLQ